MVKIEEKRNMAGVGRFERPIEDPKSSALPLGYTPICFIIILEDTTEKQAGFSEKTYKIRSLYNSEKNK